MSRLGQSLIIGGLFLPEGSEVPSGVDVPARYLDAAGIPTQVGQLGIPPKGGPGSGRDAWEAYAAEHQVAVHPAATRDEIVAALDAADVPTED